MSWFEVLFGIAEAKSYTVVQSNFQVLSNPIGGTSNILLSKANGRRFRIGRFFTPTLNQLRSEGMSCMHVFEQPKFTFDHIISGDILTHHASNPGAVFQAASQFNCLEFANPSAVPERGVTIYAHDPTQGPACAIACAAGTVYRNYLLPFDQKGRSLESQSIGQTRDRQLNTLDLLEKELNNDSEGFWYIKNGYTHSSNVAALRRLGKIFADAKSTSIVTPEGISMSHYDNLMGLIKLGLHENVGVDFRQRPGRVSPGCGTFFSHSSFSSSSSSSSFPDPIPAGIIGFEEGITVTQAYCSAVSCAYTSIENDKWEPLARLVLEGAYEATLWAGVRTAAASKVAMQPVSSRQQEQQQLPVTSPPSSSSAKANANANSGVVDESESRKEIDTSVSATTTTTSRRQEVFLTLLGGGVFGNEPQWIAHAIGRGLAVMHYHQADMVVHICHYRHIDETIVEEVERAYRAHLHSLQQTGQAH